ncbi:MAG TPA: polymer-forming cytoskeletal protein [Pyrinomonadaceae bacterium]|jgi:cytoskeletal protein CcmA (bactofilin family)|nr:polymer-forming cytoskeletal protein [Pyrinomonadaceae bacterium]
MPPAAKPALGPEPGTVANSEISLVSRTPRLSATPRLAGVAPVSQIRPVPSEQPKKETSFQPRLPVITGEAHYRGSFPVDGIISGNLGATGSTMTVKQRPRPVANVPELDGELSFKDMLRVNGHIAGKVFSYKGTLLVDASARVDADIDVKVCVISGVVNGDVMAHERVELGSSAIINGNIATRAITMKPGAVFHGDCRMLKSDNEQS